MAPKYVLVANVCDGEAFGDPELMKFETYQDRAKEVSAQTGDNGWLTVLAEITGDYKVTSKTA